MQNRKIQPLKGAYISQGKLAILTEKCSGTKPIFNLFPAILARVVEKKAAAFALLADVAIRFDTGLRKVCMVVCVYNCEQLSHAAPLEICEAPLRASRLPS